MLGNRRQLLIKTMSHYVHIIDIRIYIFFGRTRFDKFYNSSWVPGIFTDSFETFYNKRDFASRVNAFYLSFLLSAMECRRKICRWHSYISHTNLIPENYGNENFWTCILENWKVFSPVCRNCAGNRARFI